MKNKADSYAVKKSDEQTTRFANQANSVQAMENMETAPQRLAEVQQIQQAWSQSRTAEQAHERMGGMHLDQSQSSSQTK